jgi:hypothetical protein
MDQGKDIDLIAELDQIIRSFAEQRVDYALCGGFAVAVHGYLRATTDIDLVILERDLEAAKSCLKDCGFIFDNGFIPLPSKGVRFYRMAKIIEQEVLMVDILFTDESSSIWRTREKIAWRGGDVWVLSKASLIWMKDGTGRSKDQADVEELRRLENED